MGGTRNRSVADYSDLTQEPKKQCKSLLAPKHKTGGRNNQGKITIRHIGGGHKQKYRIIDFKRNKFDILGKVARIEYDPNRNARIALIYYPDGEKRYILCPNNFKINDTVISGSTNI